MTNEDEVMEDLPFAPVLSHEVEELVEKMWQDYNTFRGRTLPDQ